MPREIKDVKKFLDLCKSREAPVLALVKKVNRAKKSAKKGPFAKEHVKFKVRTPRTLYTHVCDARRAAKIEEKIPTELLSNMKTIKAKGKGTKKQ